MDITQSVDPVLERHELGGYRWALYGACAVLMALEGYDAYIVANLAPIIARSLGIAIASMAVVFSAQSAGMALGYYTIPLLADRFGRRGIIILCSGLFAMLTLLSTQVGTLSGFVLVRFLAFAAFGGALPNVVALIAEFIPDARRGRLLTWLFIAHGLGASAAGLIGPTFVQYHSWQAAFWAGGVVLLIITPLLFIYLPESCRYLVARDPRDARIGRLLKRIDPAFMPIPGALFVTAEANSGGSPVAGLFREGRAPVTVLLWLAMGTALCATATLSAWMPSYLHVLGGLPTATATRMSAVSAFGAICGPVMLTLLMKRMTLPHTLMFTLFLSAFAMTGLAAVASVPWLGWVLGFGFGLLVIGSQAGLNSLVASSYPTTMRSTGIGWAGGLGRLTSMVGPGLGGAMLAAKWTPIAIYTAIATPLLVAAFAMLLLARVRSTKGVAEV